MIKHLNFNWAYQQGFDATYINQPIENSELIDIPHSTTVLPIQYANEKDYQIESTYQKTFTLEPKDQNQHIELHFEGVAHEASIYLNGVHLGTHQGGYTPFSFDITPHVKFDEDNLLTVKVDARETLNFPPFGHVIDYLTFGGIYREVYLKIRNHTHIKDLFIYTHENINDQRASIAYELSNDQATHLKLIIKDEDKVLYENLFPSKDKDVITFDIKGYDRWDINHPKLYDIKCQLMRDGKIIDQYDTSYGFRHAVFKADGFFLNGKHLKLVGLNKHQDYPYVGYAMPKSAQVLDAKILKHDLNVNMVRTSHYPQSKHFIEACDQLGLLVFEEIPGWQHIGDEDWKSVALKHVEAMVKRDRNHPSIVLWGTRINESGDDDPFYLKTHHQAKSLDPSRQTGGVRFITHSSVLEDVFTLNDFIYEGHNTPLRKLEHVTDLKDIPYLVTEHTGHMFPTKSFDPEHRRLEHTKRHMEITEHMLQDPEISGSIGWCMHDYYTHIDFGSGDKICYHGVLDLFRNTKMAAHFYQSQQTHTPFLETSSSFSIGDYNKGFVEEAYVFSNCEQIKVYRNNELLGELRKDPHYIKLLCPPYQMDWFCDVLTDQEGLSNEQSMKIKTIYRDLIAHGDGYVKQNYCHLNLDEHIIKLAYQMYGKYVANWGSKSVSYRFEGLNDGKPVIEKTKGNDFKTLLNIFSDTSKLSIKETYDVTRITIEKINEHGARLVYAHDAFTIETDDLLEVIGETTVSLIGGIRSFWVKTKKKAGISTVTIHHMNQSYNLNFKIEMECCT